MSTPLYFVENLTIRSWVMSIFPRMFKDRSSKGNGPSTCYLFDVSRASAILAGATAWIANAKLRRMEYNLEEVTDDAGLPVRLRVDSHDLFKVQEDAMGRPLIQCALDNDPDKPRFPLFLAKSIALSSTPTPHSLRRALYMIHVCAWETKRSHPGDSTPQLFLERVPWLDAILPIALEIGLGIIEVRRSTDVRERVRRIIPTGLADLLRLLRFRRFGAALRLLSPRSGKGDGFHPKQDVNPSRTTSETIQLPEKIAAVEYFGQLNLDRPELHSELFFWQQSTLAGSELLVTFSSPNCPLDGPLWTEIREHEMSAVATYRGATTLADAPLFFGPRHGRSDQTGPPVIGHDGLESAWLKEQFSDYGRVRDYWSALFSGNNVGVFVTYNKMEAAYCAIADALESLGGISVNYQRSYPTWDCLDFAAKADVMFNYSRSSVDLEIRSGSAAKYHVVTGYLGDHRFAKLREGAEELRESLRQQGAKRVLAFFDENSADDGRWHHGHNLMRDDYAFLLEKVLTEPWFGLVIKSKKPKTLRTRLGPVSGLLEQAEATGRCFLFEVGGIQGWYPPAAAALASDLAVHEHLIAATAGMEAALAGVPTILMDQEKWGADSLYRLGVGKVVFTGWAELWDSCLKHWTDPDGLPELGDWSPMLDEFDPFRDGRAAERMGTYIQWLLEGLREGSDREAVMARAAERYGAIWGEDKIVRTGSVPLETKHASCNYAVAGS